MNMPVINIDNIVSLSDDERSIAELIVKKGNVLRSSKPKVVKEIGHISGKAAYVWRMVAFYISPVQRHKCMPCMAKFDIEIDFSNPNRHKDLRALTDQLDGLVSRIVDTIPSNKRHGINAWARAFGKA